MSGVKGAGEEQARFGAPEHGEAIERVACERFGMEWIDGPNADGRTSDGIPVQIKACRVEHANGDDTTVPGRWDCWRDPLLSLLYDDGQYLLIVYDEDVDPEEATADDWDEYVLAASWLDAQEFGGLIGPDSWHDAHRDKGQRARVPWTRVFEDSEVSR